MRSRITGTWRVGCRMHRSRQSRRSCAILCPANSCASSSCSSQASLTGAFQTVHSPEAQRVDEVTRKQCIGKQLSTMPCA